MASFKVKMDWRMLRKREKKKLSFRFVLTRRLIENSKKIAKKFKKLKKIPLWLYFNPKSVGNHGTERK